MAKTIEAEHEDTVTVDADFDAFGSVTLLIEESTGNEMYVYLKPGMARKVAKALLKAADKREGK